MNKQDEEAQVIQAQEAIKEFTDFCKELSFSF